MNNAPSEVIAVNSNVTRTVIPSSRPQENGLIAWRMKRVCKYVDQQLAKPITLLELANVAGLSRMYFAAQFRKATGIRPHEFVLRRRVERSQEMLLHSELPIIQIALDTGFETQSHFSVVFKRVVGTTPGRWRELEKNWWSNVVHSQTDNDSSVLPRHTASSHHSAFAAESMQ